MGFMTLDQFRTAVQTGGLSSVGVTASGGSFYVTGKARNGGDLITLATTRSRQERAFRDPGKAIAILHEMGAHKVEVDTSDWSPEEASATGARPDTAERQKQIHAAAAYDAWFRAEVEQALREADDPATEFISNEEVMRESAERRAKWRAQAAGSDE